MAGAPLELRYLHPAAKAVGVKIGGWHDFRHTLIRKMRKAGVHPVVVSGTVGHKRVELAPEVSRSCEPERNSCSTRCGGQAVATKRATKWFAELAKLLKMVSAEGIEPSTY